MFHILNRPSPAMITAGYFKWLSGLCCSGARCSLCSRLCLKFKFFQTFCRVSSLSIIIYYMCYTVQLIMLNDDIRLDTGKKWNTCESILFKFANKDYNERRDSIISTTI